MEIHPLRLGTVQVRRKQLAGEGSTLRRWVDTLLDPEWTDPLPINAWVLRHPEGLIVVDTGESSRATRPGYYPRWHPYHRRGVRIHVASSDEIEPQLAALAIRAEDVRWVVLTHLHSDHAGGLGAFRSAEIVLARREWLAVRGFAGKLRGYLPHHLPTWLSPRLVSFDRDPLGPFRSSWSLTRAGDVVLVPTPGHTPGHLSVVVREGPDQVLFLAGDASYTQKLMVEGRVDGVALDVARAAATLAVIRRYVERVPVVYLPSHDPASANRFERRAPVSI